MTETMKHTGAEMGHLASSEQRPVATTMRGLFRIKVYPRRRWKWWGKRGWLVVLHLLHEQGDTWCCRKFFTSFPDLCSRLGIDPDDPIWQDWTHPSIVCSEPAHQAKDQGWMPFCMF